MPYLCSAEVSKREQANTLIAVCGSVRVPSRTQSHLTDLFEEKDTHTHTPPQQCSRPLDYSFSYRTHTLVSQ